MSDSSASSSNRLKKSASTWGGGGREGGEGGSMEDWEAVSKRAGNKGSQPCGEPSAPAQARLLLRLAPLPAPLAQLRVVGGLEDVARVVCGLRGSTRNKAAG